MQSSAPRLGRAARVLLQSGAPSVLSVLLVVFALVGCQLRAPGRAADPSSPDPATAVPRPPTPDLAAIRTWTDADSKATSAFAAKLRADHPDAAWPHWFSDKTLAWTSIGLDGGGIEGLIATDGTISPDANTVGLQFWLRDGATGKLYTPQPGQVSQRLARGQLPIVISTWKLDGATLELTTFVRSDGANPIEPGPDDRSTMVVEARLTGTGPAHPWTLFLVARPYGPAGGISPIQRVDAAPDLLRLDVASSDSSQDQSLSVIPLKAANVAGALDESAVDASLVLGKNSGGSASQFAHFAHAATSARGLAEGFLGYHLEPSAKQPATLAFAMPMWPGSVSPEQTKKLQSIDPAQSEQQVENAWWTRLHRVTLSLPDQSSTNAFYASLAYLLMARRGSMVSPGAMNLRRMWVRDAVYITDALDKTGNADVVEPVLKAILASQLPSGRFPPIINANGTIQKPLKTEWDTEGEAITALVLYAQDSGNTALLRSAYPAMLHAASYQRQLIRDANANLPANSPFAGLLPAGDSAEDLYGDGKWHHLWDDLWAIAGFQQTATLAREYGHPDDAQWLTDSADKLRAAVLRVGEQTKLPDGQSYLPNGPEDHKYTAMARSVTPALWPIETLDPSNPLVQQSFAYYYQRTVKPYHGAYLHYGDNFWPYAGISLAHAFYRLGWIDDTWTMYQWAMQHQTAPNLYSWPEAINQKTLGWANGDMPNSWMSAEMILLTRDLLLHEDGNRLDIGPFFAQWLPAGGMIQVGDFPTAFGPQSYTLKRSADGKTLTLTLSGTPPPGGYQLTVPAPATLQSVQLDGGPARSVKGSAVTLPPGTHQATLTLAPSKG